MKTVLDYPDIDALSVVELPDRNVICDCGCPLIEVNILSGDTFVIGSSKPLQQGVNVFGNQNSGTPGHFYHQGNKKNFSETNSLRADQDNPVSPVGRGDNPGA